MKLHRFIGDFTLSLGTFSIKDIEIVKQIRNVLKLEVGEPILLGDGRGHEARASITALFSDHITCTIEEILEKKDTEKNVSLYLAILKKDNFELAIQKATECGVSTIIPIITERTIKTGLNTERLEKIIKEASEQSGRSLVPTLLPSMDFKQALIHGEKNEEKIVFHLVEETYLPKKESKNTALFIGPEGGFTEKEITHAKEQGYTIASLGNLTLRGETAAIIATYRTVQGI